MILGRLCRGVPDEIGLCGADGCAHLRQLQHLHAPCRAQVGQVQRDAEIAADMEAAGQQHRRRRRRQQALGHAPVTLLLHGEHGRQLAFRQQLAVRFADLRPQRGAHGRRGGGRPLQCRRGAVNALDLGGIEIGRQQRRLPRQGVAHQRPVQRPVPARLPGQCARQIARPLAARHLPPQRIDPRLLLGVEHLQQQRTRRALRRQGLQQPQLQGMMIGVVMLLADQQPRRRRQALDQLRRRQPRTAVQIDDHAQLGLFASRGTLPGRQRRQRLAGGQQDQASEQPDAHREAPPNER